MKSILIILPQLPYPLQSGGQIAVYGMIDKLRSTFNITVVCRYDSAVDELMSLWPDVVIKCFKPSLRSRLYRKSAQFLFKAFLNVYGKLSGSQLSHFDVDDLFFLEVNKDLIATVNHVLRSNTFDAVQVEFFEYLPLITFLKIEIPSIFVHHEIRFVRRDRSQLIQVKGDAFQRMMGIYSKNIELGLLREYKKVIAVSDVDKKLLSTSSGLTSIESSPFPIKPTSSQSQEFSFENKLFFLGGSNHFPNYNALEWFVDNCWTDLLDRRSNLKLIVIGSWSPKARKNFQNVKNMEFLGFVDKLEDVFKNGIMVVPMLIGSGMRMKIVDAVNFGIPFVTTQVGVEGLPFRNDFDCFIADSPELFIERLLCLADSPSLQSKFRINSRNILQADYGYDMLVKTREDIYHSLLEN
jgi:glycosyltransferase involved in cell wall biosynthesis